MKQKSKITDINEYKNKSKNNNKGRDKKKFKVKKRIKRIAIHRILEEGIDVNTAVKENVGVNWRVIDNECSRRGF